jgi:hypothetical protein
MFGLGESTSRLGESSSSVRTGHRRLLRLLRRRYLRSGGGPVRGCDACPVTSVLSRRGGPVRGCDACPVRLDGDFTIVHITNGHASPTPAAHDQALEQRGACADRAAMILVL